MKNIIKLSAIAILLVLGNTSLYADQDKDKWKMKKDGKAEHFKEMDTNQDGAVSKAEFDIAHDKHFAEMDKNGDGKLTHDEMRAGHKESKKKRKESRFDKADTNNDGMLSREEVAKIPRLLKRFEDIDTSKDGQVSQEELEAAMKRRRGDRP